MHLSNDDLNNDDLNTVGQEAKPRTVGKLRGYLDHCGLVEKYPRLVWLLSRLPQGDYVFIDSPGIIRVESRAGTTRGFIHVREQSFEPAQMAA